MDVNVVTVRRKTQKKKKSKKKSEAGGLLTVCECVQWAEPRLPHTPAHFRVHSTGTHPGER